MDMVMSARLTIFASGSSGNTAYLETPGARILIDAGLSGRQIRQRMLDIGRSPENLTGILVTHEHTDHINGLGQLANKIGIPVYCNRNTHWAAESQLGLKIQARLFETGRPFEIGDLGIESFSIPHDAQDPVGFLIRTPFGNVGFATDLGHATKMIIERIKPSNILVLESNHDVKLLQNDTKRPWATKQRILSRHGQIGRAHV